MPTATSARRGRPAARPMGQRPLQPNPIDETIVARHRARYSNPTRTRDQSVTLAGVLGVRTQVWLWRPRRPDCLRRYSVLAVAKSRP